MAFHPTVSFGHFAAFDDNARLMLLIPNEVYIPYDDILAYSYLEEQGNMGRGGIARAFSFVFSGEYIATAMNIRLLVKGSPPQERFISFLITPTKSSNFIYRSLKSSADAILEKLSQISPQPARCDTTVDYTDELRKLAQLKAEGILTEEEFQAKKKQLLNI